MSKPDLSALLHQRNDAWERLGAYNIPIRDLSPKDRQAVDTLTAQYHEAERAIVRALVDSDMPVVVGDVILHLTTDRQHFVELDAKTQFPVYVGKNAGRGWKTILYQYPKKSRRKSA